MSEDVLKNIPSIHLVFIIVNGFFVFLLTPLHIPLSSFINPFASGNSPTEALSSVAFLLLISSIVGLFGFEIRNFIIGNNGLFAHVRGTAKKLDIDFKTHLKQILKDEEVLRRNASIANKLRYYSFQTSIINAVVVGTTIAFLINIPFWIYLAINLRFFAASTLIFAPLVFGVPVFLYDKFHFRNELRQLSEVFDELSAAQETANPPSQKMEDYCG